MKSIRNFFFRGVLMLMLLGAVFGLGYFLGQVSIASRNLRYHTHFHLAVAGQIRTNNNSRALVLLEQTLRHELWGIARWSRYTRRWQRHSLYDAARRIEAYYSANLPGELYISLEKTEMPTVDADSWRIYANRSNTDIRAILSCATNADVIAKYEAVSASRSKAYHRKMLKQVVKRIKKQDLNKVP